MAAPYDHITSDCKFSKATEGVGYILRSHLLGELGTVPLVLPCHDLRLALSFSREMNSALPLSIFAFLSSKTPQCQSGDSISASSSTSESQRASMALRRSRRLIFLISRVSIWVVFPQHISRHALIDSPATMMIAPKVGASQGHRRTNVACIPGGGVVGIWWRCPRLL